jgi:hypothetical protein
MSLHKDANPVGNSASKVPPVPTVTRAWVLKIVGSGKLGQTYATVSYIRRTQKILARGQNKKLSRGAGLGS